MTDSAAKLLLWSDEQAKMGMWASREKKVVEGVCLLTVALYRAKLTGASLPSVRSVLPFAISQKKAQELKALHISI
jgi:hypothetical protein